MERRGEQGYAGDLSAQEAWEMLRREPGAVLVDVRTGPEWAFVGIPDLATLGKAPELISWQVFPTMGENPGFVADVTRLAPDVQTPVLFLCRSGGRSRAAAIALTSRGYAHCYNITDGFEGPLDGDRHRGTIGGWKAADLPWRQQ